MRLRSLSVRGVTTFTHRADVDFAALGPGLVALVGPNGAGKTSLLESVPLALYRSFPSRPNVYDYCLGRDAFVEAVFDGDAGELKVRLQIDAEQRKTEGYLFLNGVSLTSGRAAEFHEQIEKYFHSYELFLASVFASQTRSGDFLRMAKGERKALFVELLGLVRLEHLQAEAGTRRSTADRELAVLRSQVAEAEQELAGLPAAEASLAEAVTAAEAAAGALETARQEETAATSALERARGAEARLVGLWDRACAADRALGDAGRATEAAAKLEVSAQTDANRRRVVIRSVDPDAQERSARQRHGQAIADLDARQKRLEAEKAERQGAEAAAKQVEELEAERAQLEAVAQESQRLAADLRVAESAEASAERQLQDAEQHGIEEEERLTNESKLLREVPCTAATFWRRDQADHQDLAGTCKLLGNARQSAARLESLKGGKAIPPGLRQAVKDANEKVNAARQLLETAEIACDPLRLAEIKNLLPGLRAKAARLSAAMAAARALLELADDRSKRYAELSVEIANAQEARERIAVQLKEVDADLVKATAAAAEALT